MTEMQIEPLDVLDKINQLDDAKLRLGYTLVYLAASSPVEVFGKYAPTVNDVVEYSGRVLFKVKCSRYGGAYRPVLLPKTNLVVEVLEWIKQTPEPFLLHTNLATSKTYAMNNAKKTFTGYTWLHIDHSKIYEYEKWSKVLKEAYDPMNQAHSQFPKKEKPFTLLSLKKLRQRELIQSFGFSRVEFNAFTEPCVGFDEDELYEIGMIYYDKLSTC